MSDKIKVELLREIKHGAGGKVFKYSPAKRGVIKHTMIPRALYEALKDTVPPHFRVAREVVVETVGAVEDVSTVDVTVAKSMTKDEKLAPVADIEYADPEAVEAEVPTIPSVPLAEDASVGEVQAKALEEINGVGPALARNLVEAGYNTVADVALADADDLDNISGIHSGNVDHIIEKAKELVS